MRDKVVYPNSWEVVKLGEIAESEKGKKPKNENNELTETFCYPYIDIEAFEKLNFKTYTDGEKCVFCDENDFLMVWDGSRSGLVGKGVKGALGSTLVRIKLPKMNNRYAYYFLQSKYLQINTRAKGSGTPHVDPDLLWNYDFPIPPLNEQNRIVTKIEALFSEIDNGIDSLSKAKFQLEQYRQSLLKSAFEGKLTEQWRADYEKNNGKPLPTADELLKQIQDARQAHYDQQLAEWELAIKAWEENSKEGKKPSKPIEPTALKRIFDRNILELPNDWQKFAFGDLIDIKSNLVSPKDYQNYPHIAPDNIEKNTGKLLKYRTIEQDEVFSPKHLFYKGQIIYSKIRPNLSKLVLIDFDGLCSADMYPLESKFLDHKFLKLLMLSKYFVTMASTAGSRSLLPKINQKELSKIVVPYCTLAEQSKIIEMTEEKFSITEKFLQDIKTEIDKANVLKSSILQKAFQGKLVAQDDNDPPASELLEEIKQEREQALALIQEAKQAKKANKPKTTKRTKKAKTTENQ